MNTQITTPDGFVPKSQIYTEDKAKMMKFHIGNSVTRHLKYESQKGRNENPKKDYYNRSLPSDGSVNRNNRKPNRNRPFLHKPNRNRLIENRLKPKTGMSKPKNRRFSKCTKKGQNYVKFG